MKTGKQPARWLFFLLQSESKRFADENQLTAFVGAHRALMNDNGTADAVRCFAVITFVTASRSTCRNRIPLIDTDCAAICTANSTR